MITVTIAVKPHLAAYTYARFANCVHSGAIRLPSTSTLYHCLAQLTVKRHYLGAESARIIEQEIDTLLKMELYSRLLREKYQHGRTYTKALIAFMEEYHIDDANEHALMKAFQRWRKACRVLK